MFFEKKLVLFISSALLVLAAVGIPLSANAGSLFAPGLMARAAPQDAGPTAASTTITTSIILSVTDLPGLESYVQATLTPSDPNYHRFLTVEQFRQRFAPSNQQIHQFVRYLESFGITVNEVYADNLDISVTGTADELNAAFSAQIHDYVKNGERFHRPTQKPIEIGRAHV